MRKIISKVSKTVKNLAKKAAEKVNLFLVASIMAFGSVFPQAANAQALAGTGYDAGTSALETVATELTKYIPYVVNLCYALAGIVAIVGAVSVYIAMNNEEQDVKNILVLQNWLERIRKEVINKALSIKRISEFLNFPILAQPTLKKI